MAEQAEAGDVGDGMNVRIMLWNLPQVLFFSRGLEIRGTEAISDRFNEYYQGTWLLNPDMSNFHA